MASQTISLGARPFGPDNSGEWTGAVRIDAALVDGGGAAYLRSFGLADGDHVQIRLAASSIALAAPPDPDFTGALETAAAAFTLSEAGGASIVLKGPAHPDVAFADPDEPYFWTPDNAAAWAAWVAGLGAGEVALVLDDGGAPAERAAVPAAAAGAGGEGPAGMDAATGRRLAGIAHLRQSVRDVLLTRVGTRVGRREYGSALLDLVDRPATPALFVDLYAATAEALARWEPRFRLRSVRASSAAADGRIALTLTGTYVPTGEDVVLEALA